MPDSAPLFCRPAARMNMAATVTVAELLKPLSAWLVSTRPKRVSDVSTSTATKSMRNFSVLNNTTATTAINNTKPICKVIACSHCDGLAQACKSPQAVGVRSFLVAAAAHVDTAAASDRSAVQMRTSET